ncbi:hypothetical protein GCM10027589_54560 [Actinocorallia lasiicapitis]
MNNVIKRNERSGDNPHVKSVSLRALAVAARLEQHAGHDHDRSPNGSKSN